MTISDIKTGDVLLVDSRNLLAKLIKVFQKDKYNHSGTFVWLEDSLFVFEAIGRGAVFTSWEHYDRKNKRFLVGQYGGNRRITNSTFLNKLIPLAGRRGYEFKNLFIFQPIKYLFGWWVGRSNKKSDKRFICGELTAYCCHLLFGLYKDKWHKMSPADIHKSGHFTWKVLEV